MLQPARSPSAIRSVSFSKDNIKHAGKLLISARPIPAGEKIERAEIRGAVPCSATLVLLSPSLRRSCRMPGLLQSGGNHPCERVKAGAERPGRVVSMSATVTQFDGGICACDAAKKAPPCTSGAPHGLAISLRSSPGAQGGSCEPRLAPVARDQFSPAFFISAGTPLSESAVPSTATFTSSPSLMRPSRMRRASGSWSSFWITRFKGRAP